MGNDDRRRAILRRCMRKAGYLRGSQGHGNIRTEGTVRCKEGEVEVVLTKRDWEGITACAPLEQLKNPNSYYVRVRYEKVGREWSPTIPKHNIDIRRSSKEVRAILKKTHPEWWRSPSERAHEGGNLHKMALTLEGRSEAMQELVAGINKMGDEHFWRFYNWWIENKESELVPWHD